MSLDKLQNWLISANNDVAYISDPISINYSTGYNMDPHERILALFTFKGKSAFIFASGLNVEEAKSSAWDGDVYGYLDHESPRAKIADLVDQRVDKPNDIAIERSRLSVDHLGQLRIAFPDSSFTSSVFPFVAETRLRKTPEEVGQLKATGARADFAFQIGFNALRSGVTEHYIAGQINYQLKLQKGVMHTSFETIVQTSTSAANPHLGSTMNKIEPNELVLFDLGTTHSGYAPDSSRTVTYDGPTAKEKEIYEVDREVQQAAIEAAEPGIIISELDAVTRDIITKAGYGEYFIHRLGHGIGMNVHEFPQIIEGNDVVLGEGMCFSIEPGIYVPNIAGARVEGYGVVTKNSFETFTKTSKKSKYISVKD